MSQAVLPYASPPAEDPCIQPADWMRQRAELPVPVGAEVLGWEYRTPLALQRTLRIDGDRLRVLSNLEPSHPLVLGATWATSFEHGRRISGRSRTGYARVVPIPTGTDDVRLSLDLQGDRMAAAILLHTFIAVREPGLGSGFAATHVGSRLWGDEHGLQLEGRGARLPVCMVPFEDFGHRFGGSRAVWSVSLAQDFLTLHPTRGVMVYLNSTYKERFSGEAEPVARAQLMQIIRIDVARRLIEGALDDEAFLDGESYSEHSLGSQVQRLFRMVFGPLMTDLEIEEMRRRRRSQFEERLQHAFPLALEDGQEG